MTTETREPPASAALTVQRTARNSVLVRMAERFQMDPKAFEQTIRKTVLPNEGATNEHLAAFLLVAYEYELNPLTKQIYAFPSKGGIVPIVSVDGWHSLANRHPQYDGHTQRAINDEALGVGIETTIFRKDRAHPTIHTEWMEECKRPTDPWKTHPMRMLGHKSFIQTARMAFSLSGIYDPDEGERIVDTVAVVKPTGSRTAQLEASLSEPQPDEPLPADTGEDYEPGSGG